MASFVDWNDLLNEECQNTAVPESVTPRVVETEDTDTYNSDADINNINNVSNVNVLNIHTDPDDTSFIEQYVPTDGYECVTENMESSSPTPLTPEVTDIARKRRSKRRITANNKLSSDGVPQNCDTHGPRQYRPSKTGYNRERRSCTRDVGSQRVRHRPAWSMYNCVPYLSERMYDLCSIQDSPNVICCSVCFTTNGDIYTMVLRNCIATRRYWFSTRLQEIPHLAKISNFERAMRCRASRFVKQPMTPSLALMDFVKRNVFNESPPNVGKPVVLVSTGDMLSKRYVREVLFKEAGDEICSSCNSAAQTVTYDVASMPTYMCAYHSVVDMWSTVYNPITLDAFFTEDGSTCVLNQTRNTPRYNSVSVNRIAEFRCEPGATVPVNAGMIPLDRSHNAHCQDYHFCFDDWFNGTQNTCGNGTQMYDSTIGRTNDILYCVINKFVC